MFLTVVGGPRTGGNYHKELSTGNPQNQYRQKSNYQEPPKLYRHTELLPRKHQKPQNYRVPPKKYHHTGVAQKKPRHTAVPPRTNPGSLFFHFFLFILRGSL